MIVQAVPNRWASRMIERAHRRAAGRARPARSRWRPKLERLEGRVALATFLVTNMSDSVAVNPADGTGLDASGLVSLRSAIMAANAVPGEDRIDSQDSFVNSGLSSLDITDDLVIDGGGPNAFIEANATFGGPALRVFAGIHLKLSRVGIGGVGQFSHHPADRGAAIDNEGGTVEISDSQFAQNQVSGLPGRGGAIYNGPGSRLRLENVWFGDNHVFAIGAAGGAIYNASGASLVALRCVFEGNTAFSSQPFDGVDYGLTPGMGGAIANAGGSLELHNCAFNSNLVAGANGPGLGGAVYNGPGGTLDIHDCTFSNNFATGGSRPMMSYEGSGGAIYQGSSSSAQLVDSTLTANTARGGNGSAGQGGGISLAMHSSLSVTNCTLTSNLATGGAGDLGGDGMGGGVFVAPGASLVLSGGTLSDNRALAGGFPSGSGAGVGRGGGLFVAGGTVVLNNLDIQTNSAQLGGGIYVAAGDVTINHDEIADNTASVGSALDIAGGTVRIKKNTKINGSIFGTYLLF